MESSLDAGVCRHEDTRHWLASQQAKLCGTLETDVPRLYPYQSGLIASIFDEAAGGRRRILAVSPTGGGKTVVLAAIIRFFVASGRTVLVLAHRREIISQTCRKLLNAGVEDFGVLQAGFPPRHAAVQVASVQPLNARAFRSRSLQLPPADLVIVDEAHHAVARTYQAILDRYPNAVVLGLTATPTRGDGRGLGGIFETLVQTEQVAGLIAGGFLVPTRVFAPTIPDLKGIRIERGDYNETQLAERMNTRKLTGDVVEHWLRLGEGRPTVVFASGVNHSVALRNEFRRAGVMAEHIDGSTPLIERDEILARLAGGKVQVVCNCMVLTEGWDSPSVSCLVLVRPTRSMGLYRQMVGRALRTAPGKTDAIILDHSGAVFDLGFPEDFVEWSLAPDERATNKTHAQRGQHGGPPALVTCPECHAVRFEGRPCAVCGWRPQPKPKPIVMADGELGRVNRQRRVDPTLWTDAERRQFHSELAWIARQRGHKPGWIYFKYLEKFGCKPPPVGEPIAPAPATLAWVRSRAIAFARSQGPRQ
jgi:DNA repair protein RadD